MPLYSMISSGEACQTTLARLKEDEEYLDSEKVLHGKVCIRCPSDHLHALENNIVGKVTR